ncbi:MAG TPA: glycosyltransferase family 1 protein, partial [Bacteroidia bacterium]|nr:glycosyltransferase family 1 protein [Bacteroidia bacterium]
MKHDAPILFEGLHSCYFLTDVRIKNRMKIYRESNIEHQYYWYLFESEKNVFKKIFFLSEYFKLISFEKTVKFSDLMLVVSEADKKYLQEKFPKNKIIYLPSFHGNEKITSKTGKGNYVLYHGNLSVPENEKAAIYLMKNIFSNSSIPFKIAGLHPSERLKKIISVNKNIELIENPNDIKMQDLIANAHIHLLI